MSSVFHNFKKLPTCYKTACVISTILAIILIAVTAYCEHTDSWNSETTTFFTVLFTLCAVKACALSWSYADEYLTIRRRDRVV